MSALSAVAPVINASAVYKPYPNAAVGACAVAHPWPGVDTARVAVACGGAPADASWTRVPAAGGGEELVLSFEAPLGQRCEVALLGAAS